MTRLTLLLSSLLFLLASLSVAPGALAQETTWRPTFKRGVNLSHWLAQMPRGRYGDPERVGQEDFQWISAHGYDHVRIPVDGRVLLTEDGTLIAAQMEPFERALTWAQEVRLGVIFDMHYVEGANFTPVDNSLFGNPELQARAASLWRQIAEHFKEEGDYLRFEVLNEAVAEEDEQVNVLNALLVSAIREVSPQRVIYVSSNRWGQFATASSVRVFDDPYVHYAFHYYEPFIFTHQGASWTELPEVYDKPVEFPTTLTNLADEVPEGHWLLRLEGVPLDAAGIFEDFTELAAWAQKNNVEVLISEFGAYRKAPRQSAYNWTAAVREAAEQFGFGWSVWDYEGGFAIRGDDGQPTVIHRGLMGE